ncbi:MAG: PadR family transcriptional regulator [Bryobacterales bacterium]|nr:PadR family transcriptional regulator [Bryobacterales bacterium]
MRSARSPHASEPPGACAMRNLYRFVEPVILYMLKCKGHSYGYDLAGELSRYAFTGAAIEKAALYRTLRHLEDNGFVVSGWEFHATGPARRIYSLTPQGERHLEEWAALLNDLSRSMSRFVARVRSAHENHKEVKAGAAALPAR